MFAFVLWVGVLGLAPHLWFSFRTGELSFFQSGFDEPHYYFLSLDPSGVFWTKRSNIMAALSSLFHGDAALVMMAMDFLCPMLAAAAAFLLASQLVKSSAARVLTAAFVMFSQELLSGGCMSMYPTFFPWLYNGLSDALKQFVPYFGSSFYSLYRTPEPEVSYIIMFAFMAHLARISLGRAVKLSPLDWAIQLAGNLLLGWNYIFCAIPIGILEAALCLYSLVSKRWTEFLFHVAGGLCLGASLFYVYFYAGKDLGASYGGFIFHSRLPMFSVSQLWALAIIAFASLLFWKRVFSACEFAFVASCSAIPFVLMNQQALTGLMVSTRDWEKYSIYPFLAMAIALCIRAACGKITERANAIGLFSRLPKVPFVGSLDAWTALLALAMLAIISNGQRATYRGWAWYNEMSHSYALGIRQALSWSQGSKEPAICIEHVTMEPLINMRFGRKLPFPVYFDDTSFHPIAPLPPDGGSELPKGHEFFKNRLFEYFARRGFSQAEVETLLKNEIDTKTGFFLGFLFAPIDYTFVGSDFRCYRHDAIASLIPAIAADYGRFLESFRMPADEAGALLTTKDAAVRNPPGGRDLPVEWSGRAPFHKISLFRQLPAGQDSKPAGSEAPLPGAAR